MNKIHSLLMYITYNITTVVIFLVSLIHLCTAWRLHVDPETIRDDLYQGRKYHTPGWTKIICNGKSGMGNHQSPGMMPVTIMGSGLVSIWLLCVQVTVLPMDAPLQPRAVCTPRFSIPLVRYPRQQLQDTNQREFKQTPVCGIAGEMLHVGCHNRKQRPNCGQRLDTHNSKHYRGKTRFWGPHEGVEDEIMNIKGPHTIQTPHNTVLW